MDTILQQDNRPSWPMNSFDIFVTLICMSQSDPNWLETKGLYNKKSNIYTVKHP